jgi:hypothetical protein
VGPACQREEEGERVLIQSTELLGRGLVLASGGIVSPSLLTPFLFLFQFLFCFSFVIFAKHFQNDFKQLLKLVIHFPSICQTLGKHIF